MNRIVGRTGMKVDSLPSSYLGMPLASRVNIGDFWDSIVAKFRKKCPHGKQIGYHQQTGSQKSNQCVEKFPFFGSSLSRYRKRLAKLNVIMLDFLWQGTSDGKKMPLVA